jgi:hypothetical protein
VRLFGFEIKRAEDGKEQPVSFAEPVNDDGALNVGAALGGAYGLLLDIEGSAKTEAELVTRYRSMALSPEIQLAVDEVVNEAISISSHERVVEVVLDDVELPKKVKDKIEEEFDNVLQLLDFSNNGYEIFSKFYVDGRLNYHVIIDEKNLKEGIKELRYLDPRKVRLIREMENVPLKDQTNTAAMKKIRKEYYMYSESGFGSNTQKTSFADQSVSGLRIAKDSIVRVTSGLVNETNSVVLSHLHKAIKPHNQLKMLEDANVVYTLVRAPERRVFYVDVGNLPKAKAEQYLYDMMARHKNKVTYNPTSGEINDQRKMMCYDLGTKIPLLDGRTLELREIMQEYEEGKQNWVYSCDPVTGKFYPGPVSWAGITKRNAEVVKVTFDNGKSVTCTPDHKFPVWGKGFVEAQHLTTEDSIIPGYRRQVEITGGGVKYEQIYKNETQTWEFTHREVAKWKKEVNLEEVFVHGEKYLDKPKTVIHHKDFNRYNNNPENLLKMNHKDHLDYHKDISSIIYTPAILEVAKEAAAKNMWSATKAADYINSNSLVMEEWIAANVGRNPSCRGAITFFTGRDLARVANLCGYKNWTEMYYANETHDRVASGRVKREGQLVKWSPEYNQMLSDTRKGKVYSHKTWKVTTPDNKSEIIENLSAYCRERGLNRSNIKGKSGSKGYRAEILRNHRITTVEFLDDKVDVGSLTIDRDETYHSHHTYLLDAGVYTKNTMTEDYWFPRREGNRTTEVDTLPASGSLSDNESLMYFQTKLYKSLNVPVARLQPETMYTFGRTSEITREELKFSKFIQRLRARFSILFDRCLEKQLILKGIIAPDEWKEIQDKLRYDFMKDNFFEELKQAEILREKLTTLRDIEDHIGTYFSRNWVRKNVLFMSDSDIEEMDEEIAIEKAAGEYDDGMGDDSPPEDDAPPQDAEPQDTEAPPEDEEPPEDSAEESLLINNTNTFKTYRRGKK